MTKVLLNDTTIPMWDRPVPRGSVMMRVHPDFYTRLTRDGDISVSSLRAGDYRVYANAVKYRADIPRVEDPSRLQGFEKLTFVPSMLFDGSISIYHVHSKTPNIQRVRTGRIWCAIPLREGGSVDPSLDEVITGSLERLVPSVQRIREILRGYEWQDEQAQERTRDR